MVVQCKINFDQNPYGTYFAGQMVSGTVTLRTDKVKIIKGCALKMKGSARTSWSDNVGVGSSRRTVNFYGNEDYFASTIYLLGSEESQTVTIETGIQSYNFACALPPQCPSSFEGQMGHIRYTVKVVFIRPWKFDQTYTRGFTVIKLMDLNYESPILRMPAAQETYKTFCWGPCKKNPLKVDITVPQTGFVPGQSIPVSVLVTNESNVPVTDVKISLIMMTIMFSQQPSVSSRIERTNLAKIKGGAVKTYSTRNIIESIRIPPTPPSCNRLCSILQISYQIEVEVKLKGMHENPIMLLPLVIGNVPLLSVVQQQPLLRTSGLQLSQASAPMHLDDASSFDKELFTVSNGSILPVVDPVRNPTDPLSSAELNISPPSYEEAVYMARANCNEGDQHALASSEFVPRYPVYNIPELCAPICDEPFTNTDPNKSTWL